MRTIQPEELTTILESHGQRLYGEGGERADLSCADLSCASLRNANLTRAYLYSANLRNANLYGANLTDVNLYGANLTDANLTRADLGYSNLGYSNLYSADLSCADLSCASLRNANLYGANLTGANLTRADLNGCVGNMKQLKSMQLEEWPVTYTADRMQIGCQNHTIDAWREFTDAEISDMDGKALEWWTKYKALIFLTIETSPAEPPGAES